MGQRKDKGAVMALNISGGGIAEGIDAKSIFAGIKDAKEGFGNNYIKEGQYWLLIKALKITKSRKGIVQLHNEVTVVKVFNDANGTGHKLGEDTNHCQNITANDSFLGNFKTMVAHIMGVPGSEIGEAECMMVCGADQILKGMIVEVSNRQILTKTAQKPFTVVDYKREVPPAEALKGLDPQIIERFFPNNVLERRATEIAKQSAPQTAPAA